MKEEEEDQFIKENPIVFKKYKVKKKIGEGAFGDVYLGQTISNNAYVALKVEQRKIVKPILESEAFLLYSIAGIGIPEVKSFGKVKNYNILVEPLLGRSLFDIFSRNNKEMPVEDVCLIGKQVIDRIEWVHSKNIVHRDIKPDNFLIGIKDPNVIYLIDFGLSKKYRSSTTNKHIRFGFTGKLTGTVRFASANALRGGEQSRRDDIESIGYMLVYFLKKKLPWQGITGRKKMERYLKIYKIKKNTKPEELCEGFPEMIEYIKYTRELEFEQEPDYNYLRKLFNKMLKRINNTKDQLIFSWIKLKDFPNLKNPINPATRRDSPQSRIYKKIKSSLEKERNLSSESDSRNGPYQQGYSQVKVPNSNLKVVDNNNNFTESEYEQHINKKLNKKDLKNKEGLYTTIANLDATVDENIVDFENERLKKKSKDTGYFTNFSNTNESNCNSNKNISNFVNEQNNNNSKKEFGNNDNNIKNPENNNINNNLNSEVKNNLEMQNEDHLVKNIDPIQNNLDTKPKDNKEKKDINNNDSNKNNKKVYQNNNNNNNINNDNLNNKIMNNINNIDNQLQKITTNKNNTQKNNIQINKLNNNINKNEFNEKSNIGKKENDIIEFTFNESLNIQSNQNFNKNNQESKNNNMNNITENIEKKNEINEEIKNNIYALITGNNQYKNNEEEEKIKLNKKEINVNNLKEINNKPKYQNIDNINNIVEYLNLNHNQNKMNNSNNTSKNNIKNINFNNNMDNLDNININLNKSHRINKNKINNNFIIQNCKISVKKINKKDLNNNNKLPKQIISDKKNLQKNKQLIKEPNNNINIKKPFRNESIKKLNNNSEILQSSNKNSKKIIKIYNSEISNYNFPNDNNFNANQMMNQNNNINILKNISNSSGKKKINKDKNEKNDEFFNNFYINKNNNNNEILKTNDVNNKTINLFKKMDGKNNNIYDFVIDELGNKKYRGSNYNYNNNNNNLNYGYTNQRNIISNFPEDGNNYYKKILNNQNNLTNNMKNNLQNLQENINFSEFEKIRKSQKSNKNLSNSKNKSINNKRKEMNKTKSLSNIKLQTNNGNNNMDVNMTNINNKNNYIKKLGNNDNYYNNNLNGIKNNINPKIIKLQPKKINISRNQMKNNLNSNRLQNFTNIENFKNINYSINNNVNNYNINYNINNNLINNNINRQQINYQIPGYINNKILYNNQYLNSQGNLQPLNRTMYKNQKNIMYIGVSPTQKHQITNYSMMQGVGIQYVNNFPNNYTYRNIENILQPNNNNMYFNFNSKK